MRIGRCGGSHGRIILGISKHLLGSQVEFSFMDDALHFDSITAEFSHDQESII